MKVSFIQSIHQVEPSQWNSLWGEGSNPFCQYGFLAALEDSGSVGENTGWGVHHALVHSAGRLVGAMPLFVKMHSYGEYVFDWAWADAYARYGLDYYPKLVNAIPFTPSTGPRLGLAEGLDLTQRHQAVRAFHGAAVQQATDKGYSGWHSLFPDASDQASLSTLPLTARYGYQFHWFNQNYRDFDEFLASFSSRKRKNVRKERQRVAEAGLVIRQRKGDQVSESEWQQFYTLYQRTYLKRSGSYGYLGSSFFPRLAAAMPHNLLLVSAHSASGEMVAAAFYLQDSRVLYGRYWGALEEYDALHFEACYYQGIDYAIQTGLERFDPGAQGEHKIQRGFTPLRTCSYHWLADSRFAHAVQQYCEEEASHVDQYIADASGLLPFREGWPQPSADALIWQGNPLG